MTNATIAMRGRHVASSSRQWTDRTCPWEGRSIRIGGEYARADFSRLYAIDPDEVVKGVFTSLFVRPDFHLVG